MQKNRQGQYQILFINYFIYQSPNFDDILIFLAGLILGIAIGVNIWSKITNLKRQKLRLRNSENHELLKESELSTKVRNIIYHYLSANSMSAKDVKDEHILELFSRPGVGNSIQIEIADYFKFQP